MGKKDGKKSVLSETAQMEEEMRKLRSDGKIAGGSVIPFLHWLGMQIFSSHLYKEAYWGIFLICLLCSCWLAAFVALLAGLLSTLASYKRPPQQQQRHHHTVQGQVRRCIPSVRCAFSFRKDTHHRCLV